MFSEEDYLQEPKNAYFLYVAVKNHFSKQSYDFLKYGGKTKCKTESFEKRKDKFLFYRLATKYSADDIVSFYVSQAIDGELSISSLSNNLLKSQNIYKNWLKRINSIKLNYNYDLKTIALESNYDWKNVFRCDRNFPLIFRLLVEGKITPESYSLLHKLTGFIDFCEVKMNDALFITSNLKYKKYVSFLFPSKKEILGNTPKNLDILK